MRTRVASVTLFAALGAAPEAFREMAAMWNALPTPGVRGVPW
jgi:hypothetical protein